MSDWLKEVRLLTSSPLVEVRRDDFDSNRAYVFCEDGTAFRCDNIKDEHPRWERYILPDESEPPAVYPPPCIPE